MKLSVYDLDHTLCRKSTLKLFYQYLLNKRIVSRKNFVSINLLYLLFIAGIVNINKMRDSVLCILKDKSREEISGIAEGFLSELKTADFRQELLEALKLERGKGYFLLLLTGAPDIYAHQIGKKFGFDKVISTKTEFKNDRFLGRALGVVCNNKEKTKLLKELIDSGGFDLSSSRGYGNEEDAPWLNLLSKATIYKEIQGGRLRSSPSFRLFALVGSFLLQL